MSRRPVRFILREVAVALQRESLAEHGGIDGIRDEALLLSALHRCVNRCMNKADDEPDASTPALAASLGYGLAMNHAFIDGNKRIAMIAAFVFLELNGLRVVASELDAYEVFIDLAVGKVSEAELAKWLARSCE
ncbi:MAG: type II toxin-antitoxin system death-on-curing family toxin [Proteobacteria bacterium]|nr:type II toxin-antitoxin system death-on-curing family toxin [Pseudomonadota bacterium]